MLSAFTAGLLLITVSELGDKTFFIAVILAMRHSRRLVFTGVTAALAAMTILSVLIGQAASLFPQKYIQFAEISLFLGFGIKLLYDASRMPAKTECGEVKEAEAVVNETSLNVSSSENPPESGGVVAWATPLLAVLMQAFSLTFLAEWGDRTQFATITLAASQNPVGVSIGAILGHSICAAIAVLGGRFIACRISERMMTALGGGLFLLFGGLALLQGVSH